MKHEPTEYGLCVGRDTCASDLLQVQVMCPTVVGLAHRDVRACDRWFLRLAVDETYICK